MSLETQRRARQPVRNLVSFLCQISDSPSWVATLVSMLWQTCMDRTRVIFPLVCLRPSLKHFPLVSFTFHVVMMNMTCKSRRLVTVQFLIASGELLAQIEGKHGPPKTPPSCSAWPKTPKDQFWTPFGALGGSYGLKTTPVTPVTDLKVSLDPQRLHHRAQRGRKPLYTNFQPSMTIWADFSLAAQNRSLIDRLSIIGDRYPGF